MEDRGVSARISLAVELQIGARAVRQIARCGVLFVCAIAGAHSLNCEKHTRPLVMSKDH